MAVLCDFKALQGLPKPAPAARANAVVRGRTYVLPDDVKTVAIPVLAHRIITDASGAGALEAGAAAVRHLLETVPSPRLLLESVS